MSPAVSTWGKTGSAATTRYRWRTGRARTTQPDNMATRDTRTMVSFMSSRQCIHDAVLIPHKNRDLGGGAGGMWRLEPASSGSSLQLARLLLTNAGGWTRPRYVTGGLGLEPM